LVRVCLFALLQDAAIISVLDHGFISAFESGSNGLPIKIVKIVVFDNHKVVLGGEFDPVQNGVGFSELLEGILDFVGTHGLSSEIFDSLGDLLPVLSVLLTEVSDETINVFAVDKLHYFFL